MSMKKNVSQYLPDSCELDDIREQVKSVSKLDPNRTIFYLILDALDSENRETFASTTAVSVYQWYGTSGVAEALKEDMELPDYSAKVDTRYSICCQLFDLVQKSLRA